MSAQICVCVCLYICVFVCGGIYTYICQKEYTETSFPRSQNHVTVVIITCKKKEKKKKRRQGNEETQEQATETQPNQLQKKELKSNIKIRQIWKYPKPTGSQPPPSSLDMYRSSIQFHFPDIFNLLNQSIQLRKFEYNNIILP